MTANTIMPVRKRTTAANPRVPRRSACAGTASVERWVTDIGRETPWSIEKGSGRTPVGQRRPARRTGQVFGCSSVVLQLSGRSSRWQQSSPARGRSPSTSAPESSWTDVHASDPAPTGPRYWPDSRPVLKGRASGRHGPVRGQTFASARFWPPPRASLGLMCGHCPDLDPAAGSWPLPRGAGQQAQSSATDSRRRLNASRSSAAARRACGATIPSNIR